jgi:hypothetical protein
MDSELPGMVFDRMTQANYVGSISICQLEWEFGHHTQVYKTRQQEAKNLLLWE